MSWTREVVRQLFGHWNGDWALVSGGWGVDSGQFKWKIEFGLNWLYKVKRRVYTYIVVGGLFNRTRLDRIGNETQDCSNPEEQGETTEQVLAELDPLRGLFGGSEGVGSISFQELLGLGVRVTLDKRKDFWNFFHLSSRWFRARNTRPHKSHVCFLIATA